MRNTSASGAAAEHLAAAILSSLGYAIYWPMDPSSPFDLLIAQREDYLKVQVKRARWVRYHRGVNESLIVSTTPSNGGSYKAGDFDLLCAVDDLRTWLIPFADCSKTTLTLAWRGLRQRQMHTTDYDPAKWLVTP